MTNKRMSWLQNLSKEFKQYQWLTVYFALLKEETNP